MTFDEWCSSKVSELLGSGRVDVGDIKELYDLAFEFGYNSGYKSGHENGYTKAVADMEGLDFMSESGESGE